MAKAIETNDFSDLREAVQRFDDPIFDESDEDVVMGKTELGPFETALKCVQMQGQMIGALYAIQAICIDIENAGGTEKITKEEIFNIICKHWFDELSRREKWHPICAKTGSAAVTQVIYGLKDGYENT